MDNANLADFIPAAVAPGCRVVAHDALNARMVDFGWNSRGTPIRINAEFAEADLRIVIGQIDPHQFVGFTGGSKGAVIGVASAVTIEHNHSLFFDPLSQVGRLKGNPVREDINEAGRIVGYILPLTWSWMATRMWSVFSQAIRRLCFWPGRMCVPRFTAFIYPTSSI